MTKSVIPFYQPHLNAPLPTVIGHKDYKEFRSQLERIDELLIRGGVEEKFVELCIEHKEKELTKLIKNSEDNSKTQLSAKQTKMLGKVARCALRCSIARELTGASYRDFSNRLADSYLFQRFCLIDQLAVIKPPSKSTLQRYEKLVREDSLRKVIDYLNLQAGTPLKETDKHPLNLEQPLDLEESFIDCTCIKANIHFPVDWVLLRDAVISLISAIIVIRSHGLKNRIVEPKRFITRINNLCIQMGNSRRKKNAKKERKRLFRLMKELVKAVQKHGERYRELLNLRREDTDLSEKQAAQIIKRLDNILNQLPQAIKQANERIIGERLVKNEDKILSLHEDEIHVIVRGKAGAEVEYGNGLVLVEQKQGIIIDYDLIKDQPPADTSLVLPSLERIHETFGIYPDAIGGDRGFDSGDVRKFLANKSIYNGICPKSPKLLKERQEEEKFRRLQKRRAQTEARIGILKNSFLGRPLRSKGFENKELSVGWAVLAHNLWSLARLLCCEQEKERSKAA